MRSGPFSHSATLAMLMAALLLPAVRAHAHTAAESACTAAVQQRPDLVAARAALQRAPDMPGKRLKLADLLLESECFDEAIHVLEDGVASDPHNANLQNRLIRARSMVREKQYFEGLDEAEATARASRSLLRCTRLGDVAACDDILSQQPRNLEVLMAKGDALAKANKTDDALAVYARAAQQAPDNTLIAGKVQALQAQRQELLHRCNSGEGDAALQACMASLVKGAPNEFDTTLRIAILQQSGNQTARALDSYIAANSLRHGNKSVALAILALLDSTQRKDAVALAARGSSLVTLGRPAEALAPLRQAYALAPGLPGIGAQIDAAEVLARTASLAHKEGKPRIVAAQAAAAATPRSYSNAAPPGNSN